MTADEIDREMEVTLQAVDQIYGHASEPNQSRAPEAADSPRHARSTNKRRTRRGPTAVLLESQEDFESDMRTRALLVELRKDRSRGHPEVFHAKHSRVQRKVQKLEALQDRLVPSPIAPVLAPERQSDAPHAKSDPPLRVEPEPVDPEPASS